VRPTPTPADDSVYPSFIRRIKRQGYARNSVTWQLPPPACAPPDNRNGGRENLVWKCRIPVLLRGVNAGPAAALIFGRAGAMIKKI
jgi:hypothetical protein